MKKRQAALRVLQEMLGHNWKFLRHMPQAALDDVLSVVGQEIFNGLVPPYELLERGIASKDEPNVHLVPGYTGLGFYLLELEHELAQNNVPSDHWRFYDFRRPIQDNAHRVVREAAARYKRTGQK